MSDGVYYADLTELAKSLQEKAGGGIEQAAAEVVSAAGQQLFETIQWNAPRRTGTLASSTTITYNSPLSVTVGPTAPYAGYVEFGTGPHVITARNAKVLAFKVNGRMVFARTVHHPGTKANPFVATSLTDTLQYMSDSIAQAGGGL